MKSWKFDENGKPIENKSSKLKNFLLLLAFAGGTALFYWYIISQFVD